MWLKLIEIGYKLEWFGLTKVVYLAGLFLSIMARLSGGFTFDEVGNASNDLPPGS